ncbi:MAG: LTA synthase family protein [Prevotella sp.]|nr:LTA synthase family protein [Prevotella sp.]
MTILFGIDVASHVIYCLSSPSMRYLGYVKHRLFLELLSQQCYIAQPVYANFQRGSIRSLGYGIIENLSGTMMLTDIQKKTIQEEIDDLKPVQECAKTHPDIRNVIFVLVESYMSFTVNMKVKGKEVTPFLNSLYRDSTVYYNGQMEPNITLGESSDGQFIYMTGLLPLRSAITVTKAKKYSYPALPKQVAMAKRIHTQMVIPTAPSMWNQDVMCERYGVESLYSTSDYKKLHSMYLSDDQVVDLADSVNIVSKQPFFSMVLTFSMHQPYVDKIDPLFNVHDENFSVSLNNYLNACHFTDRQLRRYFDGLKEQGLYDQSLIIIASDHHVGSSALELPDSLADRHLPLFIINGGEDMSKAWKGECNQLDVYTTILDLLNIKSTWRGLGHSLLSSDYKNSVTVKKWDISEWIIKSGFFNDKKN